MLWLDVWAVNPADAAQRRRNLAVGAKDKLVSTTKILELALPIGNASFSRACYLRHPASLPKSLMLNRPRESTHTPPKDPEVQSVSRTGISATATLGPCASVRFVPTIAGPRRDNAIDDIHRTQSTFAAPPEGAERGHTLP